MEYHRLVIGKATELGLRLAADGDFRRLPDTLATKIEPQAAVEIAKGLVKALENAPKTDILLLWNFADALRRLVAKMEASAAAEIAGGLATALKKTPETDYNRVQDLAEALEALAAKLEPQAAAEIASDLAMTLENAQEMDSDRLSIYGAVLAALGPSLPSARHTHVLALSNLLLSAASREKEQSHDQKLLTAVCAQLGPQDLADVLKYPFCTEAAEQIVLNELETKTGLKFGGDVWKLVGQADVMGIKEVDSPAKRPLAQDALKELDAFIGSVAASTTSP